MKTNYQHQKWLSHLDEAYNELNKRHIKQIKYRQQLTAIFGDDFILKQRKRCCDKLKNLRMYSSNKTEAFTSKTEPKKEFKPRESIILQDRQIRVRSFKEKEKILKQNLQQTMYENDVNSKFKINYYDGKLLKYPKIIRYLRHQRFQSLSQQDQENEFVCKQRKWYLQSMRQKTS